MYLGDERVGRYLARVSIDASSRQSREIVRPHWNMRIFRRARNLLSLRNADFQAR